MNFQRVFRRPFSTMSTSVTTVSPFSKLVVGAMRKLYPEELADRSFDNTGLLLEAPYRNHLKNSVLLTIDLTTAVADEAIARKDSIIVTYHPIIFRALKSITLANTQQNTLLRLAQEGISVYSPHTAVDAAPLGLNDFLADVVAGGNENAQDRIPSTISVITPVNDPPEGFQGAGYGRIVRFQNPQKLGDLARRINQGLGNLSGLSVAVPQSVPEGKKSETKVSSVGICAGSGGSMLTGLDVDLLFTGELSHHEALAAIEQGKCVITAFHSNSERAFLAKTMRPKLTAKILSEMVHESGNSTGNSTSDVDVAVSKVDRDPFEIVTPGQSGW